MIKRILIRNGIEITKKNIKALYRRTQTKKVGAASKGRKCWSKGLKMTREHNLKNMKAQLKYDVSLEWLSRTQRILKN